jgi:hypothetical protein
MTSPCRNASPIFLTAAEAATLLRVSVVTIGRWRIEGSGPPFRKFGRRVVYLQDDLIAWADAQSRASTSDVGPPVAPTSRPNIWSKIR